MVSSRSKLPPDLGMLLTLGWAIPVWLLCGIFAGRWIDAHWGLTPWATLAGGLLGMIGAGYTVVGAVKKVGLEPPPSHPQSIDDDFE
jgi:F0F1-type ATP synthase assembly protein I